MARDKFDFEAIKANHFKTNDRGYLAKCQTIMLGYEPEDIDTVAVIRTRLQDALGAVPRETVPEVASNITQISAAKSKPLSLTRMPNLSGNGKWEGRMRRIKYIPRSSDAGEQVVVCRWEEMKQDVIAEQEQDLPWPLYMNFCQAVDIQYWKEHLLDEGREDPKMKGRLITIEHEKQTPKYKFMDYGDVPGTADLPESYFDYFQKLAEQTGVFKGITRTLILKVHGILFGIKPMTAFIGVTDEDLRMQIAVSLGPKYEEIMQAELYGEAVA